MPPEVSSLRHSSRKKQRAGITQTITQTVKYIIKIILCPCFRSIRIQNQNRWLSKSANEKLRYSLIGSGIWWISLPRKTDFLTIGGAKAERQDFGFITSMVKEEEGFQNNRHWSKNVDWAVIRWKKMKTIKASMLLLSGSMVKNFSSVLQHLQ